jgi:hypothetical protein
MYDRRNGWRVAFSAAVVAVVVVSLNPPMAVAKTDAPPIIPCTPNVSPCTPIRPASDPHVEGCSTFVGGVQHDYLCMYTSSDMDYRDPDGPLMNYYPMSSTYVYIFDPASGKNPADPANWVDTSNGGQYPAFKEEWLRPSTAAGVYHLWAPTVSYGNKRGETLLYVPDVYGQFTIPGVSQDGRVSYIAVATNYSDSLTKGGNPWGQFRYKKNVTYKGAVIGTTYMSDPAVATLAHTHPVVNDLHDEVVIDQNTGQPVIDPNTGQPKVIAVYGPNHHPIADEATWLLWANGDNNQSSSTCGGISIGRLADDDFTDLVDDPARSVSEITVTGIEETLGHCDGLHHPYMEGPELYDLTQAGVPLPCNTGPPCGAGSVSEPYMLFFAAKPRIPDDTRDQVLAWATASDVRGPYTYRGMIMDSSGSSWTNHGSITAGSSSASGLQFVLWYHDDVDSNARPHHRQARAACLTYDKSDRAFVTVVRPSTMPDLRTCVGTQD